jgi:hypothetical protein
MTTMSLGALCLTIYFSIGTTSSKLPQAGLPTLIQRSDTMQLKLIRPRWFNSRS